MLPTIARPCRDEFARRPATNGPALPGISGRDRLLSVGEWISFALSRIIGLVTLWKVGAGARRQPADGIQ
jgi:hypothetical protein